MGPAKSSPTNVNGTDFTVLSFRRFPVGGLVSAAA